MDNIGNIQFNTYQHPVKKEVINSSPTEKEPTIPVVFVFNELLFKHYHTPF